MNVALAVTGCIAAYKAVDVMRGLQKAGVSVQVVLTRAAARFVAPLTFEALSGRRVITDMFRGGENVQIQHIAVAQQVGSLAVVPATANRSEEHTSELQSRENLVCRLLLEKKKIH